MSEATFVETQKQHVGVGITQSFYVSITSIRMEMVVALSINVVKRGNLIVYVAKLGSELGGVLVTKNLSWSSTLPIATTRVVGTPQMVFTNAITTTYVNRTTDQPLMSSMVIGGYKNVNAVNPRGRYQEPFVINV